MAPAAAKGPAQRKRARKRKRRAASLSSSSSSSSSESESDEQPQPQPVPVKKPIASVTPAPASSGSGSDSEDSSSSSSSDSEVSKFNTKSNVQRNGQTTSARPPSRSPSPIIDAPLPSFLPSKTGPGAPCASEDQTKTKFRQFWMESIVDGFKDDLETIRKVPQPRKSLFVEALNDEQEPSFGPSKLALLIDSLASGADVFTNATTNQGGPSEMDVILG